MLMLSHTSTVVPGVGESPAGQGSTSEYRDQSATGVNSFGLPQN